MDTLVDRISDFLMMPVKNALPMKLFRLNIRKLSHHLQRLKIAPMSLG